ncbi:MAG: glutamine synthetase adenylyltransferase [Planctomycetota bacterium]
MHGVRFEDVGRARRRLADIAGEDGGAAFEAVLPKVMATLAESARPDEALVNLRRYMRAVTDRAAEFDYFGMTPRAVEILIRLFDVSPFLTDIVIRHPHYLRRLTHQGTLVKAKTVWQWQDEFRTAQRIAEQSQGPVTGPAGSDRRDPAVRLDAVRRYRRWEILRIGTADAFGLLDLQSVTNQLSDLAEAVVRISLEEVAGRHGVDVTDLSVLAYGKLGGRELNYSSDIDLVFVSDGDAARYVSVARDVIADLTQASLHGFLYRVDMRLRPWGRSGALVSPVDTFANYLSRDAAAWEIQALLKARHIAGGRGPAKDLVRRARPIMFGMTTPQIVESVKASKAAIEEKLGGGAKAWGEVKSGTGSIRDIEFTTQALQLTHGGDDSAVRKPNTLEALDGLLAAGRVTKADHRILRDGYDFLRATEHALQLTHDTQTHRIPDDRAGVERLASRLRFRDADEFLVRYESHVAAVRAIYSRYLGGDGRVSERPASVGDGPVSMTDHAIAAHPWRIASEYRDVFRGREIAMHAELLGRVRPDRPVVIRPERLDRGDWRLTVVGIDHVGGLTVVCGLLFCYGFDIVDGEVFTDAALTGRSGEFVNALTVRPPAHLPDVLPAVWKRYEADLTELATLVLDDRHAEAQAKLARRVAHALREYPAGESTEPPPVEIEIDNAASDRHSVLHIRADDTPGFLYELTNALALCGYAVDRVIVRTDDDLVRDTLWVREQAGGRVSGETSRRQIHAAAVLVKNFTHMLPQAPNPEAALLHFRELVTALFARDDWSDDVAKLGRTEVLGTLARLLGMSDFLWEDFLKLRFDSLIGFVTDATALSRPRDRFEIRGELLARIDAALADVDLRAARRALNEFKDREMFRVDLRHIVGRVGCFTGFSEELADVADAVIVGALRIAEHVVTTNYGRPRDEAGEPARLAVLALGKCGGRELGYASDVELMFVFDSDGRTDGTEPIGNAVYFNKVAESFLEQIEARQDGMFEVDLRLRPHGAAGDLACPRSAFRSYYLPGGAAWSYERQALVKLRPVAGDSRLGRTIVSDRDELLYNGVPFDVPTLKAMRERQIRQLVTAGTFQAKLSPGGLVDCEYLVQVLQVSHGHRDPSLRSTNTRRAIDALRDAGLLTAEEHMTLAAAYLFLRRLIDALRVVRGNAGDLTVPEEQTNDFEFLARRLGYDRLPDRGPGGPGGRLAADIARYAEDVVRLRDRLIPS